MKSFSSQVSGVAAGQGMLCCWAGASRGHWQSTSLSRTLHSTGIDRWWQQQQEEGAQEGGLCPEVFT